MLKKVWFLIFVTIVLSYNISLDVVLSEEPDIRAVEELNLKLYDQVKLKKYEKAKQTIEEISSLFSKRMFKSSITVEGIEAISSAIIETKRSLAAIQPNDEVIVYNTTRLYLAIDALTHKQQPLWHRYHKLISKDINELLSMIDKDDFKQFEIKLNDLQAHYNLIKPAVFVSEKPSLIEKIDSLFTALTTQKLERDNKQITKELQSSFNQLFHGNEKETWGNIQETTLWKTSLGMGLIIFVVLSYVIWRKFRGTYFSN